MTWHQDARHAHFDGRVLERLQWVLDWWTKRGFQSVALPWMVPEYCLAATRPVNARMPEPATSEGGLAASGKQSLLWLDDQGLLPTDGVGLIGWTPCFRHEAYDRWHHHYFLKAELFMPVSHIHADGKLGAMVTQVQACWQARARQENLGERKIRLHPTGAHSVDLMLGHVELGSYGVRPRLAGRGSYLTVPHWPNLDGSRPGQNQERPMSMLDDLPYPLDDLLCVERLKSLGVVPHYFGLGFIQMKLDDIWRVHVWVPEWPTIPGAENELHDHRYGFDSHVLAGALEHDLFSLGTVYRLKFSDAQELVEVTCQPGSSDDPTVVGHVFPEHIGSFRVEKGQNYALGHHAFHRSRPIGPTVTLVKRGPMIKDLARVIRPSGAAFTCPFSLNTSVDECWAKVNGIFEATRS